MLSLPFTLAKNDGAVQDVVQSWGAVEFSPVGRLVFRYQVTASSKELIEKLQVSLLVARDVGYGRQESDCRMGGQFGSRLSQTL
jgi:hypothetical protein